MTPQEIAAYLGVDPSTIRIPPEGSTALEGWDPERAMWAMHQTESVRDGYSAVGPAVPRDQGRRTDYAYGRYQVMGDNLPEWTQRHLGRRLTPEEFLADPQAQDRVFQGQFGEYYNRHGNYRDAASRWFTGRPYAQASAAGANDRYTSVDRYVRTFENALNRGPPSNTQSVASTTPPSSGSGGRGGSNVSPEQMAALGMPQQQQPLGTPPVTQPAPTATGAPGAVQPELKPPPIAEGSNWTTALQDPATRAFLMTAGFQLMAGGWGNPMSQLGVALGRGAEAASATVTAEQDRDLQNRTLAQRATEGEADRTNRREIAEIGADSRTQVAQLRGQYALQRAASAGIGRDRVPAFLSAFNRAYASLSNNNILRNPPLTDAEITEQALRVAEQAFGVATAATGTQGAPPAGGPAPSGGPAPAARPGGPAVPARPAGAATPSVTYEQWQIQHAAQLANPNVRSALRARAQQVGDQTTIQYLDRLEQNMRAQPAPTGLNDMGVQ